MKWGRLRTICRMVPQRVQRQCLWALVAFGLPLLGFPLAHRGGARWEEIKALEASGALRQIVCSQTAGQPVVYAVVDHWGVFLSEDNGQSWLAVNRRLPQGPPGQVAIGPLALAPDDPQFLVVGVSGQVAGGRPAIYKTRNGGRSWVPRRGLGTQDVNALAIAPGGVVYAAGGRYLYCSTDTGDTWLEVGSGPPDSAVLALGVDPEDQTLYAGTDHGLWLTTDRGVTWTALLPGRPIYALAISERGHVYAAAADGLHMSADRGTSWQAVPSLSIRGPAVALAVRSGSPDQIFVAWEGQPIRYSLDGGVSWRELRWALLGAPVTALAPDPQSERSLYVGTRRGLWRCTLPPEAS